MQKGDDLSQNVCKLLLSAGIEANNLQEADVDLGMVCHFIESKLCNIQLSNSPKVSQHNYMAVIADMCAFNFSVRATKSAQGILLSESLTTSLHIFIFRAKNPG